MEPLRVLITGAAGQIAYSLIQTICNGDIFGKDQTIILHLLDVQSMLTVLHGVSMEIEDMSLPLVKEIVATVNEEIAFKDIDICLLLGSVPRNSATERRQLLKANANIFKCHGIALDKFAKKTVKVLAVGNPANTNCYIVSNYATSIPRENFTSLTRLDENRAKFQLASKLKVSPDTVKNVIIWGNHSATQYPDVRYAKVNVYGQSHSVYDRIDNENWLKTDFISQVRERGTEVINARKLSSAMSAARAISDHMHDWWNGTNDNEWVSMGVISDGSYDIEKGLVFSYPVQIKNQQISIIKNLSIDLWSQTAIKTSEAELIHEREEALESLDSDSSTLEKVRSKI